MRLLGKRDNSPAPLLADSPFEPPAPAPAANLLQPSEAPALCPACLNHLFWQDVTGKLHCRECVEIPAVRMVRDFWELAADALPGGGYTNYRWRCYDPFARSARFGVKCQAFAHLEQAQAAAAVKQRAADGF